MKKVLLLLIICFSLNFVMAQRSDVNIISGNSSMLVQNTNGCIEFNYSKTKVVEFSVGSDRAENHFSNEMTLNAYLKSRGDDFVKDWPEDHVRAENFFVVKLYQSFTKRGKIQIDRANPYDKKGKDYLIRVNVDYLDMGNAAGAFVHNPYSFKTKGGGAIFKGTVDIINLKTNKVECVFDAPFVKSSSSVSETHRLALCYNTLAANIVRKTLKANPTTSNSTSRTSNSSSKSITSRTSQQRTKQDTNSSNASSNTTVESKTKQTITKYDVVTLKNGSVLKGTIIENSDTQVKIKTNEGDVWTFKRAEVKSVTQSE